MTPTVRYGKPHRQISNEEVFVKNYHGGVKVRERVLKDNLIPYKCALCGQPPEWHGKKLTLTLDHINGDHYDNRIENLRFLCPNCDSQRSTYGAKNKKGYGSNCTPKGRKPSKKARKKPQTTKLPKVTKEEFMIALKTFKNFTEMGKRYGVSDNAIRKWCRKWDLPVSTDSMKIFVNNLTK